MTYCPCLGSGMADHVPGVRFGVKYRCLQLEFRSERSKLISLRNSPWRTWVYSNPIHPFTS